jgi:hypothetical protein
MIGMELESSFDSATAAIGDPVRARVVEDVRRSGKPILPKGAIVTGRIRSMERQARAGGFLRGIELTGMRWENSRAEFRAELPEHSGTQIGVASGIPGAGRLFVKGEQWRLAPGLQMVWRTLSQ